MLKEPVVEHRLRELIENAVLIKIIKKGALLSAMELFGQPRILRIEKELLNFHFRHLASSLQA